jgi:hypothetical protein
MRRFVDNHRLTKLRVLAALLLATLGFVVVLLVLTRLPGGSVPLLAGPGRDGHGGCYLNFFVDELVADPVSGTAVVEEYTTKDGPQSRVLPIMWPAGYTGRRSGSEVEVLDRHGQVVARTGSTYRIQGGYEEGYWLTCSMIPPMLNWTPEPAP